VADVYRIVPGEVDVEVVLGDEFGQTLTVNRDLTGYTFEATVAGQTITTAVISAAPTVSSLRLSLTETQVAGLGQGEFPYRLRWTAPGDVRRTILAGKFKVTTR
jgi:hypothetical protein